MSARQAETISESRSNSVNDANFSDIDTTNEKSLESNILIDGPPKDQGYAWVIMAVSVINTLFSFGSTNAFGVFQAYYLKIMFVDEPADNIAWISTVCITCTLCGGLLAGPIIRRLGLRNSSLLGTLVASIGLLLASFSTKIWHLVLTQGVIFGLGSSMIVNISLTAPSLWFDKYRNVAIGTVATGGSMGSLVLVPIVTKFISFSTIGWAFRALCAIYFVCTGICGFFVRPRVEYKPSTKIIDFSLLKDPAAIMIFLVGMFMQIGFNVVILYFPSNLIDIGTAQATASNLIMVFASFSLVSRITLGYFSKTLGEINIPLVFHFITAILFFAMWYLTSKFSVLLGFYILFGVFGVSFFSLGPVIVAKYYPEDRVAQMNGLSYLLMGLTIFAFVPSTGVVFEKIGQRTSYKQVILIGGVAYFLSVIPLVVLKILVKRYNPNFKKNI
ncbi:putative transporter MCH2 [Smittium culicis]|uniref:Putative transporter MCH2 n=1 Tax=Smittium culicis TaxID=133412 RepID=A0A1R1YSV7_9FUNG|nr:putative transporter MCH2 [Smittium culicis]